MKFKSRRFPVLAFLSRKEGASGSQPPVQPGIPHLEAIDPSTHSADTTGGRKESYRPHFYVVVLWTFVCWKSGRENGMYLVLCLSNFGTSLRCCHESRAASLLVSHVS